jgi:hypothetical protein
MKMFLNLFPFLVLCCACTKDNTAPKISFTGNLSSLTDNLIGQQSKWKCTGGDTIFADTLILTLKAVTLNGPNQQEMLTYSFSFPIWNHKDLTCNAQDAGQLTQLNFVSPSCKSTCFVLIN